MRRSPTGGFAPAAAAPASAAESAPVAIRARRGAAGGAVRLTPPEVRAIMGTVSARAARAAERRRIGAGRKDPACTW